LRPNNENSQSYPGEPTWNRGSAPLASDETYSRVGLKRSGVSGARRRRMPDASKTALAGAAATGWIELSPAPAGGGSGRFSGTTSTASGASPMSRIEHESQSVLVSWLCGTVRAVGQGLDTGAGAV
jgi:hypothetical protein